MTHPNVSQDGSYGLSDTPVGTVVALILAIGLVSAGIGAVALSSSGTADAGAAYLGYKAYNNELDSDSALSGGSAILSGGSTAASGAATYVSSSGTAAALGAGATATGGLLIL